MRRWFLAVRVACAVILAAQVSVSAAAPDKGPPIYQLRVYGLVDKTKEAAKDGAQRFLTELKERAAANPVAALAIGAGLAWRPIDALREF